MGLSVGCSPTTFSSQVAGRRRSGAAGVNRPRDHRSVKVDQRQLQAALLVVAALVAAGYALTMPSSAEKVAVLVGAVLMLLGAVWSFGRSGG